MSRLIALFLFLALAAPQLARHLDDEEEIVIPLIALRGDPLG